MAITTADSTRSPGVCTASHGQVSASTLSGRHLFMTILPNKQCKPLHHSCQDPELPITYPCLHPHVIKDRKTEPNSYHSVWSARAYIYGSLVLRHWFFGVFFSILFVFLFSVNFFCWLFRWFFKYTFPFQLRLPTKVVFLKWILN